MADSRLYIDKQGLELYHELSKQETDAKVAVVDVKANEALAELGDLTVTYNLYYVYDTASKKYTYEQAESPASLQYWYYENKGTAEDPNYQLVDPQPGEGEDISGKNYYIRSETTTDMGGGQAQGRTEEGESIDKTITTVIIVPTETNTIQKDQVDSLFKEEV